MITQDQESLSRLTLRQLRLSASDLGVPLYSRKSKSSLIKEILLYQEKRNTEESLLTGLNSPKNKDSKDISNSAPIDETKVVFLPRDPEWAYVFWEISDFDRHLALSQGASRLCLRLVDVTDQNDGNFNPGTLREVTVDSHSTEWYLPIPMSDRDYIVEIGYRLGFNWKSLAVSSSARVPSLHPSDQILDQFVPFSLETTSNTESANSSSFDLRDSGLHERLYQSATINPRQNRTGSDAFQEGFLPSLDNQSGVGLWASGRNESGIGPSFSQNRSFWLVADAELIVYGSTDPAAIVTIGGEQVPLASDGTFRLQVPFRDGMQNYPIQSVDSEGIEKRNITLKFERSTPEDNTNPNNRESSEWF